ncbi:MAG: HNH endonuclease [bacterium]
MPKQYVSRKLKRAVFERAQGSCEYCRSQIRYAMQSFAVEHIIPRQAGGQSSLENLALACEGCNGHKFIKTEAMDPVTENMVPLFHPRKQLWSDHFTWSSDFAFILGLTPTGRATVDTFQLNRDGLVNLRRLLYAFDKHPPKQ